ncbi:MULTISPECIES: 2'-5' RNA ligase family protein [unclassified Streptomyces]|uniref:2'-5' RNA ligase family protein n=1 Tax=unclassified Streptomyces TaxID=2593676 RepID=UPI003820BA70
MTFLHGTEAWSAESVLHVYVLVDLADPRHSPLINLITDSNKALISEGFPLCPVEPRWLHINIDQISGRPASAVPEEERQELVDTLNQRLAGVKPLEVMVGSLLSYHTGVIADLHPDEDLASLHNATRETIRRVCGAEAAQYPWSVQHLSTAYAYDSADSDEVQRRLRRIRPSHAPLYISAIYLVDVTAKTAERSKTMTWKEVARIPLGAADSLA